ncbi:MAG: putative chromate transporter [Ilumatobacteraceae bacterium]|nr:putative chromate transporter [Ilumatobacteraceae bacterium]
MTRSAKERDHAPVATLTTVAKEWGRIGCIGFGGPPSHIVLLRDLCVTRRHWLTAVDFEDAVVACNLLPGPASTQLAIYCASRVRGRSGALVGGLAFILPGLAIVLALASLFLENAPPTWIAGAGAGAGAAVAAVAIHAAVGLIPASWRRSTDTSRARWVVYATAGAAAAATIGSYLAPILLACGIIEITLRATTPTPTSAGLTGFPLASSAVIATGSLAALAWTAFKVGALAYGGGFVIIPMMRADAVDHYHWMTAAQFLDAVALGQVTPGPVTQTVAAVGYAAAGIGGGLLAAAVAFTPSFAFILIGGDRFDRLRANRTAQTFLQGAGPAAIGAILGSAIPLARSLAEPWQFAILVAAGLSLFALGRGVVTTLLGAAAVGAAIAIAGGAVPH